MPCTRVQCLAIGRNLIVNQCILCSFVGTRKQFLKGVCGCTQNHALFADAYVLANVCRFWYIYVLHIYFLVYIYSSIEVHTHAHPSSASIYLLFRMHLLIIMNHTSDLWITILRFQQEAWSMELPFHRGCQHNSSNADQGSSCSSWWHDHFANNDVPSCIESKCCDNVSIFLCLMISYDFVLNIKLMKKSLAALLIWMKRGWCRLKGGNSSTNSLHGGMVTGERFSWWLRCQLRYHQRYLGFYRVWYQKLQGFIGVC